MSQIQNFQIPLSQCHLLIIIGLLLKVGIGGSLLLPLLNRISVVIGCLLLVRLECVFLVLVHQKLLADRSC